MEAEAENRGELAKKGLATRARKESEELRALLVRQKKEVEKDLTVFEQLTFEQVTDKQQKRQVELDLGATRKRMSLFDQQLAEEPEKITSLYEVQMTRLTPVGLVLAWPEGA